MSVYAAPRSDMRPALAGSVALHVMVVGAALIAWKFGPPPPAPKPIVPVAIVSGPPVPDAAPPVPAEKLTPPTAPEPTPQPSPAPPAETEAPTRPQPKPLPPPPPMRSQPAPQPKPVAKPQPKQPDLNLDALASSLPKTKAQRTPPRDLDLGALSKSLPHAKPQKVARNDFDLNAVASSLPAGSRHAAAQRGPARPAAGPNARPAAPASLTGDELGALRDKLVRLWNPNCGVEGAGKVVVRVEMRLSPDGRLIGTPRALSRTGEGASDEVIEAAANRALGAVRAGEPYDELPKDRYAAWKDIVVRFNAREACSGR